MKRLAHFLAWALIILVILLSILNLILILKIDQQENDRLSRQADNISSAEERVNKHIDQVEESIGSLQLKDGYTPKKGIDYFDGKNGANGTDGVNGTDGLNGKDGSNGKDGQDGKDGLTPMIRCNVAKNRWEVKYNTTDTWKILDNNPVKCTIEDR